MKRSSKEIKRISRDILNDRYRIPMGAFLAASIIPMLIELPFSMSTGKQPAASSSVIVWLAELLIMLVRFVLQAGVVFVHLNMTRNQPFTIGQVFMPFRQRTEQYFGAGALTALLFALGTLPFLGGFLFFYFSDNSVASIVVLIASAVVSLILDAFLLLTYCLATFLLLDNPRSGVIPAFQECRRLMHTNRRRLFYLFLSFIGLDALIILSFGIAAIWIAPYQNETLVIFYMDCTGELDHIPVRQYT